MNPIKLLAMQAGKAQDFGKVGHGTAIPEIDPHIAAAMASGMRRRHWIACRWIWCHDYGVVNELRQELFSAVAPIAKREKWKDWQDNLEKLVDLALMEAAHPGINQPWDRYGYLQWSRWKWGRWSGRYEVVYGILRQWDKEGLDFLKRAQSD